MRNHYQSIPDRSRPGLPTTASGVAQQGFCGNYATAKDSENRSRKRGGKRLKMQREAWKKRRSLIRVGTLNIGTMNGRGRELEDMMERRNVDILCLQETKWKGNKARNIGGGCKIFYNGADGRKNGMGIVVKEELAENVPEVKRVSDRLMVMKLGVKGSILNIVSAYAPQVNNSMEEKNAFWEDLDGLIESIFKEERIVLGADLNGHVGEGNIGDEEIMGRYGAATRNKEGSMVVDFGKIMDLAIVNTYFKKKDEHRTKIGCPISVTIANLVMENIEIKAINSFFSPPKLWSRFVDDTFVTIKSDIVKKFFAHINSIEASIKFTIEYEKKDTLPFLDILEEEKWNISNQNI